MVLEVLWQPEVAFTDLDLDAGELGGNITWQEQAHWTLFGWVCRTQRQ